MQVGGSVAAGEEGASADADGAVQALVKIEEAAPAGL